MTETEITLTIDDVTQMLYNMLSLYNIKFEAMKAGDSMIYEVPEFGVKIIYMDGQLFNKKTLKGWHVAYVHPDYTILKARESVVFGLMKGGYFHFLHHNYPKVFNSALTTEGWDRIIYKERNRIYKDTPKYNYVRELTKLAEKEGSVYTMSVDPGFFDFITE